MPFTNFTAYLISRLTNNITVYKVYSLLNSRLCRHVLHLPRLSNVPTATLTQIITLSIVLSRMFARQYRLLLDTFPFQSEGKSTGEISARMLCFPVRIWGDGWKSPIAKIWRKNLKIWRKTLHQILCQIGKGKVSITMWRISRWPAAVYGNLLLHLASQLDCTRSSNIYWLDSVKNGSFLFSINPAFLVQGW